VVVFVFAGSQGLVISFKASSVIGVVIVVVLMLLSIKLGYCCSMLATIASSKKV